MNEATLEKRAVRGSAISIVGKFTEQGIRLVSNLILTRLLFPEAFGVIAIVSALMMGLEMLSDLGIRLSVIQHPRGEERDFVDTAFTLSVLRGLGLWLLGSLLAYPLAIYAEEPQLLTLIPVASASGLINGAQSMKLWVHNRRIVLGPVILVQLGGQLIGTAAMLTHAWFTESIWALVVGNLATGAATTLLSHFTLKGPFDRFRLEKEAARDIISFGGWIFVSTLITFLAIRIDVFMLTKMISKGDLGVYNISMMLASLPMLLGGQIIGSVLLPALAEAWRKDHEQLVATFVRARRMILPAGAYLCLGVALGAPPFFYFLYDERYHAAAWITPLSMISAWFVFLQEASGRALAAAGNSRALAIANAVKLVFTTAGYFAGFDLGGLAGFILGGGLGALSGHAVVVVMLARAKLPAGKDDFIYTLGAGAVAGAGAWLPGVLSESTGMPEPVAALVVAVGILVPVGAWVGRKLYVDFKKR